MIIVLAILVAEFLDRACFTVLESSQQADKSVRFFALILKLCLLGLIVYVFIELHRVIKNEPLLKLNRRNYTTHIVVVFLYFFWWAVYEISFSVWLNDTDYQEGVPDAKLTALAAITFCFNCCSVLLGFLLFYMIGKMTKPVQDQFYDPVLKRNVPFFVYLANCKQVIENVRRLEVQES